MARLFLDTSVLIKLYHEEPNSPQIEACVHEGDTILLSEITPLEFHSACYGLVRRRFLTEQAIVPYLSRFASDLHQYETVSMTPAVIERAKSLLIRWGVPSNLKPLDALQLASALECDADFPLDAFVTTDKVLRTLAERSRLTVLPRDT